MCISARAGGGRGRSRRRRSVPSTGRRSPTSGSSAPPTRARGTRGRSRARRATAPGRGDLRVVDPRSTLQGSKQRQGPCTAVVPQGWTFRAGQYGDTADLEGEGGRAHASWGIRGVNTAMRGLYGPMHGPADEATLATARADAFGRLQASASKLTSDQVQSLAGLRAGAAAPGFSNSASQTEVLAKIFQQYMGPDALKNYDGIFFVGVAPVFASRSLTGSAPFRRRPRRRVAAPGRPRRHLPRPCRVT